MGSWILWPIAHGLLFLTGHQFDHKPPPQILCLIQAGLVYAFPPYMGVLNLGLLAHVYIVVRASINRCRPPIQLPWTFVFLPTGIFLAMFFVVVLIGLKNPEMVVRTRPPMYCHMVDHTSFTVSAALSTLAIFSFIGIEVVLGIMLYRNWETYQYTCPVWGTSVLKMFAFSVVPVLVLVLSIVSAMNLDGYDFLALVAVHSMPLIAAIVFGVNKDIMRAWFCFVGRRIEPKNQDTSYMLAPMENPSPYVAGSNGQTEALLERDLHHDRA
ncbi:hypothetical protein E1B28_013511 [Marasmius oreades]|nr:uncharacterized protein E1B28_013511 [Marasmius oreades]KAG7087556.1 hypothetical protein E1B28_013511 [Marasmius oreades]